MKMGYLKNARNTKRYIAKHTLTFPASCSFSRCKIPALIKYISIASSFNNKTNKAKRGLGKPRHNENTFS